MKLLSLLPSLALLLAPLTTAQYTNPGECTGDCWSHDPGFYQRVSDGRYFRFSTGGGIYIHASNSLTGPWEAVGQALPGGSSVDHPGNTNLWAPDIAHNPTTNLYYMYYSISTLGSRDSIIGVASSPNLTPGSWTDHGALFHSVANGPYNAIDANWISVNGRQILTFGSYWNGLHQIPLSGPLAVEEGAQPVNIAYNSTGNHAIEAANVFYRRGWWYLTFSSGRAGNYDTNLPAQGMEYRIVVCRSSSATGGFVDKTGASCLTANGGSTLLASHGNVYGPGGQGVFQDSTRGFVLYYHYANPTIGLSRAQYQFGWNVLKWSGGWPSV
ncbi:Arabinan endo-1,5-alpha-L-arabinosidase C [Aspergillus cavernicola]|uniref:Arabinan endo-1,5-alpha-L-arabinosidase n=1 Tax=Aspergillus cavernicola TaxID=176166 RepID=A0ABR4I285_9EURO